MNKTKNSVNFLELIPNRKSNWDKTGDGRIFLLLPRFKTLWLRKFFLKLGKSEFVRLYLDNNGARVWDLIDGKRTVGQICDLLQEQPGEKLEQIEQRVSCFMGMLKRNNFITLYDASGEQV
ncbi:MAG: PqqD family protein [Acidobacteria bacterium]|jgi:hypothetical protein|nr:PqqD family protein [Acidobacteriota bacterium]